jgi:hypothetical protein
VLLLGLLAFVIGVLLLISPAFLQRGLAREEVRVPAAALQAIREIFPKAILGEVGLEDDNGVTLLVVEAKAADTDLEIIVSPDGAIVEVSTEVKAADVPEAALAAIRNAAEAAQITEVDRVSTRAAVTDGKLVRLAQERISYWAEFEKGALGGEITVAPDGALVQVSALVEPKDVPEAALAAILKAAEGAQITEIDRDEVHAEPKDNTFTPLDKARTAYWAAFKKGDLGGEVTVAPDGTVAETSVGLEMKDVPQAVMAAILKAAEDARITELGRDETRAEPEGGRFAKLPKADILYWAEFEKEDLGGEVSVAPDGTVIEVLKWASVTETRDKGPKKQPKTRLNRGKAQCPAAPPLSPQ